MNYEGGKGLAMALFAPDLSRRWLSVPGFMAQFQCGEHTSRVRCAKNFLAAGLRSFRIEA